MNHYPKHVGDFLRKTLGLSMLQDGAYNRALDLYYAEEKPLPAKPEVYLSLRCQSKDDRAAVDFILARYFTETPEGYRHERCDEEIAHYLARAESARENGAKGGRPRNRKETDSVIGGLAKGNPSETGSKTSHEPVTSNQGKAERQRPAPASPALPDWLPLASWDEWRRHRGKKLTAQAATRQIAKLDEIRAQGHDPATVIGLAIESGWATFYAPKHKPGAARLSAVGLRTAENLGRFIGDEDLANGTHGP